MILHSYKPPRMQTDLQQHMFRCKHSPSIQQMAFQVFDAEMYHFRFLLRV